MNKVSIKRGDKTYTTQIKEFNFSCGSLNINSGEPEFSVSRCSGSYTLDNVTYSDIADIEKLPAKTEISSPYFANDIPDVCLSQYSQYDKANQNVSYSLKGYIFDKIGKQQYDGFQLRPYAVSPTALASHIFNNIYPNIVPYPSAWEHLFKFNEDFARNGFTVDGNRIKCNNPYSLEYGFKFKASKGNIYIYYSNNRSSSNCSVKFQIRKSKIVNGKIEPTTSSEDIVQTIDIKKDTPKTVTMSAESVEGQYVYFSVYASYDNYHSRPEVYDADVLCTFDITIEAIYGGDLQLGVNDIGAKSTYSVVNTIPYPRLEPSTVEGALDKVLPLLQSTAIESDDFQCLCGARTTGFYIWRNDYMLYDTPKKISKTYLYGDADITVVPTNAYDSVDMTYSVGTETQENIETNVDVSRSTIDEDKLFYHSGIEGVALKFINPKGNIVNPMLYAFVKKKISVSGKILYKYDGTSSDVVSGSGYNPYSAYEPDNKTTTFKSWGGTHFWSGFQPEGWLASVAAGLSADTHPQVFYSAICPIDETSCYIMAALPVERSSSFADSYQIHNITISSTLNTVQYQDKSLVVGENPASITSSELICSDEVAQGLASVIVEDYHTGIMTATVNTFPMAARMMPAINEICEIEGFEDENKIPIAWEVTRREYDYSGAMYEKLGLREYICNKLIYKEEDGGLSFNGRIIGTINAGEKYVSLRIDEIRKWLPKYRSFAMRITISNADGSWCTPVWVYSSNTTQTVKLDYGDYTETLIISSCYFGSYIYDDGYNHINIIVGFAKDYDRKIQLLEFVLQS